MKRISIYFLILITGIFLNSCSKNGEPLAEFNLSTIDGKSISNADLKGKITVINVWGTWCGPCVHEIPQLNQLVEKYKNDDSVVFLASADEPVSKVQNLLKRRPFNYTQIPDAKTLNKTLYAGLVAEIPLHVIVNKEGIIVFHMKGSTADIVDILSSEIEKVR